MGDCIYSAETTALLVVDPYNDLMSEGGKLYEATRVVAEDVGLYANLRRLIRTTARTRFRRPPLGERRVDDADHALRLQPPSQLRDRRRPAEQPRWERRKIAGDRTGF
jgi:nicotinamidase-related amidase